MNKNLKKVLVGGAVAVSLLAGIPVFAQGGDYAERGDRPMMRGGEIDRSQMSLKERALGIFGKKQEVREEKRDERREMGIRNFGGLVSSVNGTSFTVDSRGPGLGYGRENPKWDEENNRWDDKGEKWDMRKGTTTITVTTDASTMFNNAGKGAGTISDVVVGKMVIVSGQFSTSTKTLTAKKVEVMKEKPMRDGGIMKRGDDKRMATGTPMMGTSTRPEARRGGVVNFFRGIFGR